MSLTTFFLPRGNRVDIEDRNPNGDRANGILDEGDRIRINNHSYSLDELIPSEGCRLPPGASTRVTAEDRRAWDYLMRVLRPNNPRGMRLMPARWVYDSREDGRFADASGSPDRSYATRAAAYSNDFSEFGFGTMTDANLRSLNAYLPETPSEGWLWSARECLWRGGSNYCLVGNR